MDLNPTPVPAPELTPEPVPSKIKLLLRNRRLLIVGGGGILLILAMMLLLRSCGKKEVSAEELRTQHLEYLTKVIEAYKARYGTYPQPTARAETPEGIRHVWGYEAEKPALASCIVKIAEDGTANPELSRCGGGVYDADNNLIGWKGTLTLESGENNIDVATRGSGRVRSPLSEFVQTMPTDPAYAKNAFLSAVGFGEYIYAIRNPAAADGEGGMEYQIAMTSEDPLTKELRTIIRGNYFVPLEDRDSLPVSLIGPGLLFDAFNHPVEGQTRPLQSLLDTQKQGFPNPVLGNGEETLKILLLERRIDRLLSATEERIALIAGLHGAETTDATAALANVRTMLEELLTQLKPGEQAASRPLDLPALEGDLTDASTLLQSTMDDWIEGRGQFVELVILQEVNDRDPAIEILEDAFEFSKSAEESILEARDEVLAYLDGDGIEEQTRSRVARKLQGILDDLPDLQILFTARNLLTMDPFLTEEQQKEFDLLLTREHGAAPDDGKEDVPADGSGETLPQESTPVVIITGVSTIANALSMNIQELEVIVEDLLDELLQAGAPLESIDTALQNLSRALSTEHERIDSMFKDLAEVRELQEVEEEFNAQKANDILYSMERAAIRTSQHGDFSALLFDPGLLNEVLLQQSPGIPDLDAHPVKTEAMYQGIPYPLP
ncbi:MAG TPA: hypothetical protein VJB60_01640 [Candidatus Peribacterales bacterium]|nr:hypothetical protein [Candidatus Peribacterales bacterium]